MTSLAVAMAAAGLASSIISFLQVADAVGNRTRQFATTVGEVLPDLKSAKELIDIIARSAENCNQEFQALGLADPQPKERQT